MTSFPGAKSRSGSASARPPFGGWCAGDETVGIIPILTGLFRGRPGKDGIWDFAGKRSTARARVELERVRNEGTQKLVRSLPPGAVVIEGGPDWFREIRMPEALPPGAPLNTLASQPPVPPLPVPRNELEATARKAQDPADDPC
jgi:hypothetical protein